MKKRISILGSTGSIGTQALEVVDNNPEIFEIFGLCAGNNVEKLKEQIIKYSPEIVCVKSEKSADEIQKQFKDLKVVCGQDGLIEVASNTLNNLILIAVTGIAGLYPTLAAINSKIDIALANKETLVAAGDIVIKRAKENKVNIIPVDSEHSAIFQCLKEKEALHKLIITASGGPFRQKSIEEIRQATLKETLEHPKWSMGKKISVDSATLMNKGLEVIEAHHLFNVDYKNIEVVIHPQSIVHSAIEYIDGSVVAQMGVPSMHIPIQYALTHPARIKGIKTESFDFTKASQLNFETPDYNRFPCLKLSIEAGKKGGIYPAILNAANEEAVNLFLEEKINLTQIPALIEKALENAKNIEKPTLKDIIDIDLETRKNLAKG